MHAPWCGGAPAAWGCRAHGIASRLLLLLLHVLHGSRGNAASATRHRGICIRAVGAAVENTHQVAPCVLRTVVAIRRFAVLCCLVALLRGALQPSVLVLVRLPLLLLLLLPDLRQQRVLLLWLLLELLWGRLRPRRRRRLGWSGGAAQLRYHAAGQQPQLVALQQGTGVQHAA